MRATLIVIRLPKEFFILLQWQHKEWILMYNSANGKRHFGNMFFGKSNSKSESKAKVKSKSWNKSILYVDFHARASFSCESFLDMLLNEEKLRELLSWSGFTGKVAFATLMKIERHQCTFIQFLAIYLFFFRIFFGGSIFWVYIGRFLLIL